MFAFFKGVKPQRANRKALNVWGATFGVKRRWFGLEPNFIFRRRILDALTADVTGRSFRMLGESDADYRERLKRM